MNAVQTEEFSSLKITEIRTLCECGCISIDWIGFLYFKEIDSTLYSFFELFQHPIIVYWKYYKVYAQLWYFIGDYIYSSLRLSPIRFFFLSSRLTFRFSFESTC